MEPAAYLSLPAHRWLCTVGGRRRSNRLRWSVELRSCLAEAQNHRCPLCGARFVDAGTPFHPLHPTLDHLLPLSLGGADHPDNMVVTCYACNVVRNRDPADPWTTLGARATDDAVIKEVAL